MIPPKPRDHSSMRGSWRSQACACTSTIGWMALRQRQCRNPGRDGAAASSCTRCVTAQTVVAMRVGTPRPRWLAAYASAPTDIRAHERARLRSAYTAMQPITRSSLDRSPAHRRFRPFWFDNQGFVNQLRIGSSDPHQRSTAKPHAIESSGCPNRQGHQGAHTGALPVTHEVHSHSHFTHRVPWHLLVAASRPFPVGSTCLGGGRVRGKSQPMNNDDGRSSAGRCLMRHGQPCVATRGRRPRETVLGAGHVPMPTFSNAGHLVTMELFNRIRRALPNSGATVRLQVLRWPSDVPIGLRHSRVRPPPAVVGPALRRMKPGAAPSRDQHESQKMRVPRSGGLRSIGERLPRF
jgi:hypothetical protein